MKTVGVYLTPRYFEYEMKYLRIICFIEVRVKNIFRDWGTWIVQESYPSCSVTLEF